MRGETADLFDYSPLQPILVGWHAAPYFPGCLPLRHVFLSAEDLEHLIIMGRGFGLRWRYFRKLPNDIQQRAIHQKVVPLRRNLKIEVARTNNDGDVFTDLSIHAERYA